MPTNRRYLSRDRRPLFSAEVLALFAELEHMPGDQAFTDGSRRLAQLLGLTDEWWTGNHVNDRSRKPCHPPWCQAHTDWHKVRAVRAALLAAVGQRRAPAA
jgi:hypothetical protein